MPANTDALIQEGVAALKAGRKQEAYQALAKAVDIDSSNEQAWLWLSGAVDTNEERQLCLENVLTLNPGNAKARKGLDELLKKMGNAAPTPPKSIDPFGGAFDSSPFASATSPFAGTGFDSNPYKDTHNEPALGGWSNSDLPATSVEWGLPDSAPSASTAAANDAQSAYDQQYDDWVAGMSLGTSSSASSAPAFDSDFNPSSGPFGSSATFDDAPADTYDPSPFNARRPGPVPIDPYADSNESVNPFGDPYGDQSASNSANSPFNVQGNTSGRGGSSAFTEAPESANSSGGNAFNFGSDAPVVTAQRKNAPAFDPLYDEQPIAPSTPIKSAGSGGVFTTVDSTSFQAPSVYFQKIPDEIQVRRISPLLIATLIILLVLNIGSIAFLFSALAPH